MKRAVLFATVIVPTLTACGWVGTDTKPAPPAPPANLNHTLRPDMPVKLNGIEVELRRGAANESGAAITLRVSNHTPTEIVHVQSWRYRAVICDEFGNAYKLTPLEQDLGPARLDPAKAREQTINFESPQAACKEIKVTLDGANIGRPGHWIFCVIPRAWLK